MIHHTGLENCNDIDMFIVWIFFQCLYYKKKVIVLENNSIWLIYSLLKILYI